MRARLAVATLRKQLIRHHIVFIAALASFALSISIVGYSVNALEQPTPRLLRPAIDHGTSSSGRFVSLVLAMFRHR
jgi:hypothetical protein